jgi:hypothetical protein
MDRITYIGRLPRAIAVAAGLRVLSPGDRRPDESNLRIVPEIDTGGAFRPDWRMQDPSKDPKEPYGGESSGTGNDHGWGNCTCVSAAIAYAYETQDQSGPQGGDMRHHQDDLSGGTDLYDMRTAWDRYGNKTLTIKSGAGWGAVKTAHNEGRAIIIQGEGNVPGSESFDGGHACVIGPETHSDGRWLFGDPLASGWQWVSESSIRDWAENLSSGIYFAVSKIPATQSTPPPPTQPDCPDCPPVPPPDIAYYQSNAIAVHDEQLLNDMLDWVASPVGDPPFPVGDAIAMVPNLPWGQGKWNQTTWYLDPDSARWGTSVWAGEAVSEIAGGTWA